MSFTKNLNNLLLIGTVLVVGSINGNCASTSIESQIISPISHSMKTITGELFQDLDRNSQNHFIESSIIAFSNPEFIKDILQRITQGELQIPVVDSTIMLSNIALLHTKLQEKASSLEIKVTKTDTSTKLDSDTIAEIQSVVSPENMHKTAIRHASNSASIHVLTGYVSELCGSQIPNSHTFKKLKLKIQSLLRDESPNKDWIISLISELNSVSQTKAMYAELVKIIKGDKDDSVL